MIRANLIIQVEPAELFPTVLGDSCRFVIVIIVVVIIIVIIIIVIIITVIIIIVIIIIIMMTPADFREDGSSVTLRSSRLFEDLRNSNASLPTTTV